MRRMHFRITCKYTTTQVRETGSKVWKIMNYEPNPHYSYSGDIEGNINLSQKVSRPKCQFSLILGPNSWTQGPIPLLLVTFCWSHQIHLRWPQKQSGFYITSKPSNFQVTDHNSLIYIQVMKFFSETPCKIFVNSSTNQA